MAIIGAILGDIAGSRCEFHRPKDLDWEHIELFTDNPVENKDDYTFPVSMPIEKLRQVYR